jgi:anti-sigma regulatory factor (Ser/Thr protein kinase)
VVLAVRYALPAVPMPDIQPSSDRLHGRHPPGYGLARISQQPAQTVTSELVSNALMHAGAQSFGLDLLRLADDSGAVAVVVTDPCLLPPVQRAPAADAEHGRGLLVVEALSARWGWSPKDPGKTVFAILAAES